MSFIIRNNELIAETKGDFKSGEEVFFAYEKCEEAIDANREFNLVNQRTGKISNAKKWERKAKFCLHLPLAIEINKWEFFCC